MQYLWILLSGGLVFSSYGQVAVMISDETGHQFTLGVDGYIQNTLAVKTLIIKNLDTNAHQLHIQLDGPDKRLLKRALRPAQPGKYQYVITRNFEGKMQLRYRGKTDQFPAGIIPLPLQKETPWPKATALPETFASSDPLKEPPSDTVAVTPLPVSEVPSSVIPDTVTSLLAVKRDSQKVIHMQDSLPANGFALFLERLKQAPFEFIRLNSAKEYVAQHPLTVAQVRAVLNCFQYDNTRLQFLNQARERISDPENIKSLVDALEYALSKEQFQQEYP